MWSAFLFALDAVAPILLYIAVGYILGKTVIKTQDFWKKLNGLLFRAFISVLLFYNIYNIQSSGEIPFGSLFLIVTVILAMMLVGFLAKLSLKKRNQKGVIWQVTYRSNYAIIGIPLAESLGGASAVAFASLVSAITIPMYNVMNVLVLSYYATDGSEKGKLKKTLLSVLKNPFIIGVFLGILVLVIRALLPASAFFIRDHITPVYRVLGGMASVASPLSLVVLGARLDLSALKNQISVLTYGTVLRLMVSPLVGLGIPLLLSSLGVFSVDAVTLPALVAVSATPVAVSSAVMVSEIGGDEKLATGLVASTSLFSMLTLMVIVTMLRASGLL